MSDTNEAWFQRAQAVIPGGVDSPVRSFRSVGGTPYTVARGYGAYVEDVEGTRYIDFVQSYGASLLGHAHPDVVEVLRSAVKDGTTFGAPTRGEVLLADTMTQRVAGLEQVRLGRHECRATREGRDEPRQDREVRRLLSRSL